MVATPLPVVQAPAAASPDRLNRLALNPSATHEAAKPNAEQEHNNDQPPHAEAQESSRGT